MIGILAHQSAQLQTLIDATNTIAQEGATHTGAVQSFLDQAAAVSSTTAAHRSNLELAINRLPRLLAVAQPSLSQLDVVAREGTPLVQQLGAAAPYLNKVSTDLGPFVTQARPGLAKLSAALTTAIPAIKHVTPVVAALGSYTTRSLPKTQLSGRLFTSLQHSGFIENFLGIVYYVGAGVARFDQTSHLLDFAIENIQNGACINYATTPVPGCGANYGSAPASAVRPAAGSRPRRDRKCGQSQHEQLSHPRDRSRRGRLPRRAAVRLGSTAVAARASTAAKRARPAAAHNHDHHHYEPELRRQAGLRYQLAPEPPQLPPQMRSASRRA